jgi:hypothetical protein
MDFLKDLLVHRLDEEVDLDMMVVIEKEFETVVANRDRIYQVFLGYGMFLEFDRHHLKMYG